jgi:hypothetical protein
VGPYVEGWRSDPFGRHEARWMSAGTPTRLVRDGGSESFDDPPDTPWSCDPEPIVPVGGPDSTRRADDAQHEYFDPQRAVDAASTATEAVWPGGGSWGVTGRKSIWKPLRRRPQGDDRQ